MVLERKGNMNIKVEIQSNSEFQSLTSSPTQSPVLARFKLKYKTHTKLDLNILHMHGKRMR
jgi:hypothetical protein